MLKVRNIVSVSFILGCIICYRGDFTGFDDVSSCVGYINPENGLTDEYTKPFKKQVRGDFWAFCHSAKHTVPSTVTVSYRLIMSATFVDKS